MNPHFKAAQSIVDLLENRFKFMGLKFGLDPILGLIPGLGDVISFILSLYIVWIGIQMKLPSDKISQMIGNVVTDFFLGIIPIVGDITDFVFKANTKNMEILRQYANPIYEADITDGRKQAKRNTAFV